MQPRAWLGLLCGAACGVACAVKSFDVEPEPAANGGSTMGGSSSGGTDTGGSATSGSSSGGSGATSGGTRNMTSAGETSSAGGSSDGNGAAPRRIGFSVFHDSASGNDEASAHLADATFDKPPGTAPGDMMLVFFGCDHELVDMTSARLAGMGWTLLDQHQQVGDDGQGSYLLYHFVDGTEPDPIVISGINDTPSGNGVQGLLSVYRGVHPSKPVNAYETSIVPHGTKDSTHVDTATPAITTSVDNCLLIAGLSPDTAVDAPVISSWPEGFSVNQTSVINPKNPYPFGWANIYQAERPLAQAATVAASTFGWDMTYGGMSYDGSLSFVLALAPAP